jgi:trehalose utilization protein
MYNASSTSIDNVSLLISLRKLISLLWLSGFSMFLSSNTFPLGHGLIAGIIFYHLKYPADLKENLGLLIMNAHTWFGNGVV